MRWAKSVVLFVAAWCAASGGLACAHHHNRQPRADEWIARGKLFLSEGDGAKAYLAFHQALGIRPGDLESQYGIVLADVLQYNDTLDLLFSMFASPAAPNITADEASAVCRQLAQCGVLDRVGMTFATCLSNGGYKYDQKTIDCVIASPNCATLEARCLGQNLPPDSQTCDEACIRFSSCGFNNWPVAQCEAYCAQMYTESQLTCFLDLAGDCQAARNQCFGFYGATIDQLISQFWSPIFSEMARDIAGVAGNDALLFDLDYYTFDLFDGLLVPVFSGTHDQVALSFFSGVASGMDAVFQTAQGLDLDVNPQVFAKLSQLFAGGAAATGDEAAFLALLQQLDNYLVMILNDPIYTDGLKLAASGASFLNIAGEEIGNIFANWAAGIQLVRQDNENQTARVIHYIDLNGNNKWDDSEPLVVPGVAQLDYKLAFIAHDLFVALKASLADGYPFHLSDLAPLFDYLQLPVLSLYVRLLEFHGEGRIDLGQPFLDPNPEGLRPTLALLHQIIQAILTYADASQG